MFDFIRNHQRLMQFMLLLLIFPSFVFFGIEGYMRSRDADDAVAKVAGKSITMREFDVAFREQMDRMRQMMGGRFDPKMFDTSQAKQDVLDRMILERAVSAEVEHQHMTVSEQKLQEEILGMPGVVGADGKFDPERYRKLLAQSGMSERTYESRLRQEMTQQQLGIAIQSSAFTPKSLATRISDIGVQERDVQELVFKPADFTGKVQVNDAMLKAYYDNHGRQFEIPEQANAEYVVLNLDAVASQIVVSDDDVKSYYDQNVKQFTVDEQRRASHILIAAGKDAPEAQKAAAKAKAEKLLAQVRKNPSDFAKLAKENSNDPGSAERGGDLDFFSKGMMVKPFEEAAYKLKQGEISDVVQSDFGYHIILLTGIKPASVKSLDEVKGEVAAQIKKQLAQKKFAEMAEVFTNTVYEQADSLKPVADKLKLTVKTASGLKREPNESAAPDAPYNNPKFLKALFSDDSIKNKRNTEAVEVAPSTLVAARLTEYHPTAKRPLDEVKPVVQEMVKQQEAIALAKKAGEEKLAALKTKDDGAGFSPAKTVSRDKAQGLERTAVSAVMKADAAKLPSYVSADLQDKGYAVYRVIKVAQPQTQDAERRKAEEQQLVGLLGQQELMAYTEVLKQKAKTKIIKPPVTSKSTSEGGEEK